MRPWERARLPLKVALAVGALLVVMADARRVWACFMATQDVRLLLGESDQGVVWARLKMKRRDPVEHRSGLVWKITGHVELVPHDGGPPQPVGDNGTFEWTIEGPTPGNPGAALLKHLDAISNGRTIPGFRRPVRHDVLDCNAARSCGRWHLGMGPEGLVIIDRMDHRRSPVPPSEHFTKGVESFGGDASPNVLAESLMFIGISEYALSTGVVRVFNLAVGERRDVRGWSRPPPSARPRSAKDRQHCSAAICVAIHPTLHHGDHLDVVSLPERPRSSPSLPGK
jgi:hypothetical protein